MHVVTRGPMLNYVLGKQLIRRHWLRVEIVIIRHVRGLILASHLMERDELPNTNHTLLLGGPPDAG
jgi:hypothetical protein